MARVIPLRHQSGSVLLESLISVLIFFIGILVLITLSSHAFNTVGQSKARNDASNLAGELIADMWVTAGTPATYDQTVWKARVASSLPGGSGNAVANGTQVTITITWLDKKDVKTDPNNPAVVQHQYLTTADIAKNN